jgi:triacylglycerol lipase
MHHGFMLASLAPARRRLVLVVAAVVVIAGVVIGVVVATSSSGQPTPRAAPPARPGPVLLVPGYGGSVTSLDELATRLRAAGKIVNVVSIPDNAEGDLNAQARVLDTAARAALATTGAGSVDIVGYSAGGVATRLWIRDDGGSAITRRVVTLGSPHHGTQLAALGSLVGGSVCPTACEQLVPNSQLLADLNSGDETPAGPTYVSIWSTKDQVVVPADSARLAGALNMTVQSVCANATVSHSELPTDHLVESMVTAELAAGPPVPLTASDCSRLSS